MHFAHVFCAAQVKSAVFLEKVRKTTWLLTAEVHNNKNDHFSVEITAHSTVIYQALVGISA